MMPKKKPANLEESRYFEEMEPVTIPAIEVAIKGREAAKEALAAAKEELETCEAELVRAMASHAEELGCDADGHRRYVSPKLEIVAILEVKPSTEKVKLSKAPKAKAPGAE